MLSLLNLSTEIQQNVSKSKTLKQNQIKTLPRFIKSYTPQPSEMYSRYERLVQHTNCIPQISEIYSRYERLVQYTKISQCQPLYQEKSDDHITW